jgi:uncharacterized delta-60 repeat protein
MGDLDTTFDFDGKVTTPIGSSTDQGRAMALQADGKIVVAGSSVISGTTDFALTRYTSTGALDTTFDGDGKVTTPIGSSTDLAEALAVQSDGKIVAAGWISGATIDFALVRYTSSGALDPTFGTGGKVTTPIGTSTDAITGIAIQPDGKIVVVGYSTIGATVDFALARYTVTGALDPTFGAGGKVTTPIGATDDQATSVAIQEDGRIVAAGLAFNGPQPDFALARYTSTGALDATFGAGGKVTTPIGSGDDQAYDVAIQADDKIVAAGHSFNGSNNDFALVRYTSIGGLDSGFGAGGKVTTPFGPGHDEARGMALQDDGKIVVAGHGSNGSNDDFALARYNTTGALDATFGGDGRVMTSIGSSIDVAHDVAVQEDGKIVVAGYIGGAAEDFAVARYLGLPGVSVNDVSVTEGDAGTVGATFTLRLTDTYDQPITVDFFTRDGTAKAATDYEARQGTRLFLAGQKTKKVTIFVTGDTLQEGNETFSLRIADAQQAYIVDDTGTGTIVDNDLPAVSVNDVSMTEANTGTNKTYAFKVTLSKAGTNTITVTYTTVDGTAVAPGDYTAKSGTLTYAPGTVTKTVNVTVKGDNLVEPNETFTLHITSATFATIADADGLGTIVNND